MISLRASILPTLVLGLMDSPECLNGEIVRVRDGEIICRNCGLVLSSEIDFDTQLPFDTTYALESSLAVGKSLGNILPGKGLFKVLAKAPCGIKDLGLRARHIRVLAETCEPPQLARLLKDAYGLSKRFGLENDKLFNQDLGINIRRAFGRLLISASKPITKWRDNQSARPARLC